MGAIGVQTIRHIGKQENSIIASNADMLKERRHERLGLLQVSSVELTVTGTQSCCRLLWCDVSLWLSHELIPI